MASCFCLFHFLLFPVHFMPYGIAVAGSRHASRARLQSLASRTCRVGRSAPAPPCPKELELGPLADVREVTQPRPVFFFRPRFLRNDGLLSLWTSSNGKNSPSMSGPCCSSLTDITVPLTNSQRAPSSWQAFVRSRA